MFKQTISLQTPGFSLPRHLEELPYWDVSVDENCPIKEVVRLFDQADQLPGVTILRRKELLGLLTRDKVFERVGRLYGVELFLKLPAAEFYNLSGNSTLVLSSMNSVDEAIKSVLGRPDKDRYEPFIIRQNEEYRIISVYHLLQAQQNVLQELYAKVKQLSIIDPLTNTNNRRGFFEAVTPQLEKVDRSETEFSAIIVDVDDFKFVNDRFGHLIGDEILRLLTQYLQSNLPANATLGRFGGEEFVIFLIDASEDEALATAGRLCSGLAGMYHNVNGYSIRITISAGVSHSKRANQNLDRMLSQADQAMYTAKQTGRNKAVAWNDTLNSMPGVEVPFRASPFDQHTLAEGVLEKTLQGWLSLLYLRDYETLTHTQQVANMTLQLARELGIKDSELEGIHTGALLHDIGKIAIPDAILFKKGKLSPDEWKVMKMHPQYAYDLMSSIPYFQDVLDIPLYHHEHWDGSGYPHSLSGKNIPFSARIFTLVDVWNALISDRPYRPAWKVEDVLVYFKSETGKLFDPDLVSIFLSMIKT
jgi:diguanylate cyclase (GGDEF)-like protein/putative nucleotidyltransferase with HDIG domain